MTHAAAMNEANTDEQYQEVKRRVYDRWGIEPHHDDESGFEGLVERVQQMTGESKEQIEAFVHSVREQVAQKWAEAQASLEPKVAELDQRARAFAGDVSDGAREQYQRAESCVREKPITSLALAFGVGIAAGLILGSGRRG